MFGPLLFLIYINDIANSSTKLDFHLFADDTNLFLANKKLKNLEITINEELSKDNNWLKYNKLTLNLDKSNFVLFRPPQKKFSYNFKVCLNNNVSYLGISIDRHLNWKEHVKKTLAKISRGIGIPTKIRHYVNTSILVQLYYSLIYPFLTYGVLAWGNTYITNL